ncbi:MAG TPA: cysteine desulfurase NifS [Candidatus Cloacimonas sp.]|jgi:cysteine desulfurase|nr:cysteine desulfurase NifS [Candidatus Cloacimonas sp.]
MIYLDYNATTPLAPEAATAMQPYLGKIYGNPSSLHAYGQQMRLALGKARQQVANLLNCYPSQIIFTSGGTESNNLALIGYALANRRKGNHIITSQIEHPAILNVCSYLETRGFQISYLPVNRTGQVEPEALRKAIQPNTILVSIMHANNETGAIQPISQLAEIAHANNAVFHTDAAQSCGKIAVDVQKMKVDMLSMAGHKLYGPTGCGALFVASHIKLQNILFGAGQELGLRPGTENVASIVGLGAACKIATEKLTENNNWLLKCSDRFYQLIKEAYPDVRLNGSWQDKLPNTLNLSFPGWQAQELLEQIPQVAASAGSACHSGQDTISPVLAALGIELKQAQGSIRFSTGRFTTLEEIDLAAKLIIKALQKKPISQNSVNETNLGET